MYIIKPTITIKAVIPMPPTSQLPLYKIIYEGIVYIFYLYTFVQNLVRTERVNYLHLLPILAGEE